MDNSPIVYVLQQDTVVIQTDRATVEALFKCLYNRPNSSLVILDALEDSLRESLNL